MGSFGSPILQAFVRSRPSVQVQEPILVVESEHSGHENASPNIVRRRKRLCQNVSTKSQQMNCLKWMEQTVEERGGDDKLVVSQAVKKFPKMFRSDNDTMNLTKRGRWWDRRVELYESMETNAMSMNCTFHGGRKRAELKCALGRGRKTVVWVKWLYPIIREDFKRLKRTGLKFSLAVLLFVAKRALLTNNHPVFAANTSPDSDPRPLIDRLTQCWIQQFQETQDIVHRAQNGKLMVSPAKQEFIEQSAAFHMGLLACQFWSGDLDENLVKNMDETHFVVNMDNGWTLGFRGDQEVKYANVVSGSMGITMVVEVTGGATANISTPFMIFQNKKRSYPICGVTNNVPGVCYRSIAKGYMTGKLLVEYFNEATVNFADPAGRLKVMFIDNAPGHKILPECKAALERLKTKLQYFPTNSTDLTQPAPCLTTMR